jgi:hypothetical protein
LFYNKENIEERYRPNGEHHATIDNHKLNNFHEPGQITLQITEPKIKMQN